MVGFPWHHEVEDDQVCEIKFEMDVRNTADHPMEVTTQHLVLSAFHEGQEQADCGKYSSPALRAKKSVLASFLCLWVLNFAHAISIVLTT